MKNLFKIQIGLIALICLVLGTEAWARCACGVAGPHRHHRNAQYNNGAYYQNTYPGTNRPLPYVHRTHNSRGTPVRYVKVPAVVSPYGYGYGNYGYRNQGYRNYGYRNYGYSNRSNCGSRGYYRSW